MDRAALFKELLRLHKDRSYRFALRLSGNADRAKDLVQDAFVRALQNIDRYDPQKPFEAWLFTILNHLYINAVSRYEARNVRSLDLSGGEGGVEFPGIALDQPDRRSEQGELKGIIQEALNRMPATYRAPLVLCDLEGMSYEEISRALMCPVNTVRTRIHRARKIFKDVMSPYLKEGKLL